MKNFCYVLLIFTAFVISSCSRTEDNISLLPPTADIVVDDLVRKTSLRNQEIPFKIINELGEDISLQATFFVNDTEILTSKKISSDLISFHTAKPIDHKLLKKLFKSKKIIIIIEEHGLIGGVGSGILEWASDNGFDSRKVLRFGGPDKFLTGCGNQNEARNLIGLNAKKISSQVIDKLKKK